MAAQIKDRTGMSFGKLTVISYSHSDKKRRSHWLCRCECGKESVCRLDLISSGHTQSCGCLRRGIVSEISRAHGTAIGTKRTESEYNIWRSMMSRCFNPNSEYYSEYGGRGIVVCEEWCRYENFFRDMGKRPSKEYSIDRVDNDLGYSKGNCRWATPEEQARNTRRNKWINTPNGPMILSEAAKKFGIPSQTIRARILRGIDMHQVFAGQRAND